MLLSALMLKGKKTRGVILTDFLKPRKLLNDAYYGTLVMYTWERTLLHVATMSWVFLVSYFFLYDYIIPISLSLLIHMICDLPDLKYKTLKEVKILMRERTKSI